MNKGELQEFGALTKGMTLRLAATSEFTYSTLGDVTVDQIWNLGDIIEITLQLQYAIAGYDKLHLVLPTPKEQV
jgi:hypothetical protein